MKFVAYGLIATWIFAAAPVVRADENILQNGGAEEGDKSPKGWSKEAGDAAVSHDWKEYAGRVELPPGTKKIQIGLQVYGPGKVWFDEVRAEYAK